MSFWSDFQDVRIAKRVEVLAEIDSLTLSFPHDILLQKAIDLVVKEFELVFIGVYVADVLSRQGVLQAGTGAAGMKLVQRKHKYALSDHPTAVSEAINRVAICVTGSSHISGIFYSPFEPASENFPPFQFIETPVAAPYLPETRSELVIPCLKSGSVVGAIEFQHRYVWERDSVLIMLPVAEKLASIL